MTAAILVFLALQLVPIMVWGIAVVTIRAADLALPNVAHWVREPSLPAQGLPLLSIVIPVYNEAARLPALLPRLRAQTYETLEIIFALDRCTDRSAEIVAEHAAQDPRVRSVVLHESREDWMAKCPPMDAGAAASQGEFIMFMDADVLPEPALASAAIALAQERTLDLLSIMPQLRSRRFFELLLQPVATMQMLYIFPPYKVNREPRELAKPFAVGPFMMIRRRAYDAAGLMRSVKDSYQDDLAIARAVHSAGGRVGLARPGGLLGAAMYESTKDFWIGWKRIFTGLLGFRPKRMRRHANRLLAFGFTLIAAQVGGLAVGLTALLTGHLSWGIALLIATASGLLLQFAATGRYHRRGGGTPLLALLFPLGAIAIGILIRNAARNLTDRKPVRYGGRDYVIDPR